MALLRGTQGDQRTKRQSVDTGTGEKRLGGGRDSHLSRGSFVNFYDDLGISSTAEGAEKIRGDEAKFQGQLASERAKLRKAQSQASSAQAQLNKARGQVDTSFKQTQAQLNAAKAQIPGFDTAIKKAWSSTQKGFVPVRIVDPSGKKVEATYMLPKEAISQIAKSTDGFEQKFVDDGKNYNISSRHASGKIAGQELHDALRGASQDVYGAFVKQASPSVAKQLGYSVAQLNAATQSSQSQFDKAYGTIGKQQSQLDSAKSQIAASQGLLSGTEKAREDMWTDVRGKYQQKKDTLRELFSNLKVEKGGKNE